MFGVYEDLVFSVDKTGSCGVISVFAELNVGMAPSAALWCVPPRKRLSGAPRTRADRFFAHRERVVYPDGNCDAVAALSALIAPDHQLTAPDVRVLPADASPALEAALWAVRTPRGNRDLQRAVDKSQRAGRARAARRHRDRLRRARRRRRRGLRAAPAARLRVRRRLRAPPARGAPRVARDTGATTRRPLEAGRSRGGGRAIPARVALADGPR